MGFFKKKTLKRIIIGGRFWSLFCTTRGWCCKIEHKVGFFSGSLTIASASVSFFVCIWSSLIDPHLHPLTSLPSNTLTHPHTPTPPAPLCLAHRCPGRWYRGCLPFYHLHLHWYSHYHRPRRLLPRAKICLKLMLHLSLIKNILGDDFRAIRLKGEQCGLRASSRSFVYRSRLETGLRPTCRYPC